MIHSKHIFTLGFDCSSKAVHMVQLDLKTGKIRRMMKWSNVSADPETRFNQILDDMARWFNTSLDGTAQQYIAIIENPIFIQNPKTSSLITHMVAGVKRFLHEYGIVYFPIDNRSWKKSCLGNGAASKEQILQFAETKWGKVFEEQDWADAAAIAYWGIQRFGGTKIS